VNASIVILRRQAAMRRGREQVGERAKGMFVPAPGVTAGNEDEFGREKSGKLNSG
jgi:hypothetical protein